MRCGGCPLSGPCRGEAAPNLCRLVSAGRADYLPLLPVNGVSLTTKLLNYGKAVLDHVAAGLPVASEADQRRRLVACQACPHKTPEWECTRCGCDLGDKVRWAEQACPLDPPKWGAVAGVKAKRGGGCCG